MAACFPSYMPLPAHRCQTEWSLIMPPPRKKERRSTEGRLEAPQTEFEFCVKPKLHVKWEGDMYHKDTRLARIAVSSSRSHAVTSLVSLL